VKKLIICLSLCLITSSIYAAELSHPDSLKLYEFTAAIGFSSGELKHSPKKNDYNVIPFHLHFGYDVNYWFGLENHKGTLSFGLEPFLNTIFERDSGVEVGVSSFIKYAYPLSDTFTGFIQGGIGPMYFSIDTVEQDEAGFNFLNQGEVGLAYYFAKDKSFNVSYRFRHISHAKFRSASNGGINSHAAIFGVSQYY